MPLPLSLSLPVPWSLRLLHVIALVIPILRLLRRWFAPWRLLLRLLWLLSISGLGVVVVAIVAVLVMSVLIVAVLIVAVLIVPVLIVAVLVVTRVLLLALRRITLVVILLLLLLWLRSPSVVLLVLVCHGCAGRYRLSSIVLSSATRFGRVYQVAADRAPSTWECVL